jgi:hypothetical protein
MNNNSSSAPLVRGTWSVSNSGIFKYAE